MAALVKERLEGAAPRARHPGDRVGRELDARRPPAAVLAPGRHRPVHEAVLVLALTVEQVEHERRALILDAQRGEAASPAAHRLAEGEPGVLLARDVARGPVAKVPGRGALAALGGQGLDGAAAGVARGALELVEPLEDLPLAQALDAAHDRVVVVLAAELAAEAVALAHELEEAVLEHAGLDRAQALPGRAAPRGVGLGEQHRAEAHRAGRHEGAARCARGRLAVAQRHRAARSRQGALGGHDRLAQRARGRIGDGVRGEGRLPAAQADERLVLDAAAAGGAATGARVLDAPELLAHPDQPRRVLQEAPQLDLAAVELGARGRRVAGQSHVGGPEGILLGRVQALIVAVQGVDQVVEGGGGHGRLQFEVSSLHASRGLRYDPGPDVVQLRHTAPSHSSQESAMHRSGLLAATALVGVALLSASSAAPERAKVGKKIPEFKFESPLDNGLGITDLQAFRGTPTLFEFWGTY
jgi:hypothetical protein